MLIACLVGETKIPGYKNYVAHFRRWCSSSRIFVLKKWTWVEPESPMMNRTKKNLRITCARTRTLSHTHTHTETWARARSHFFPKRLQSQWLCCTQMVGATVDSEEITVWSRLRSLEMEEMTFESIGRPSWLFFFYHLFTPALIGQTVLSTRRIEHALKAAMCDFSVRLHMPHGANFTGRQNRRVFSEGAKHRVAWALAAVFGRAVHKELRKLPRRANPNTQEVKNERLLISTRQNSVRIVGIRCLEQSDKRTNRYKTRNGETA